MPCLFVGREVAREDEGPDIDIDVATTGSELELVLRPAAADISEVHFALLCA